MALSAGLKAGRARDVVRRAAASGWLELLERIGYMVRGLLYAVMGLLALGLALRVGGTATDPSGSVVAITSNPFGRPLLVVVVLGLAAYSVWGFVRAIFDPLHRGSDATGIAERLGFMWSGFAWAAIALFALNLMAGGKPGATDTIQSLVRAMLTYPAGSLVAALIGVVTIGVGLGQFAEAYAAIFRNDLKRHEMPPAARKAAVWLGRFGMCSRGVTFTLVGWFVLQAGLHHNPSGARGYSGAFTFLLAQPYGHLLLGFVALGFVALGLHSFALARWGRLLGSPW
jgi:hypothetical protein